MTAHLLTELTILILAVFIGFEVISKVPTTLHTPLMSATNAIHGIVLVGAILVAGVVDTPYNAILGFILVVLASLNVFGELRRLKPTMKQIAVIRYAMSTGLASVVSAVIPRPRAWATGSVRSGC